MTRRAESSATRRRRRLALVISLALHIVALAVIGMFDRPVPQPAPEVHEIVLLGRLELEPARPKRRPNEHVRRRSAAAVRAKPAAVARLVTPPISVPRPFLAEQPLAHPPARPQLTPTSKSVASAPLTKPDPQHFSDARLAAITRSLASAIAHDRRALDPLAVSAADAPPQLAHHGLDANAISTGDHDHHGLCSPIKNWTADGFDYYFVSCNVRFSDGTYERQDVPWPVRFRPDADPFAGTGPDGALAGPLPGWHLGEGEYISPELRAYARERGASI